MHQVKNIGLNFFLDPLKSKKIQHFFDQFFSPVAKTFPEKKPSEKISKETKRRNKIDPAHADGVKDFSKSSFQAKEGC